MSKRVANTKEKTARNGRVRLGRWKRAALERRKTLPVQEIVSAPEPEPEPVSKFTQAKNQVSRFFRRGVR
jgi:hypothetical protein